MTKEILRQIEILMRPLKTRIANSIARAVIENVDDAKRMQLLQVGAHATESIDGAERFEQYGFKSVPFPGAEAVIVFPNGDRAHGLVVAVADRRHRPTGWQPGEVGLHTDEDGHSVKLARGKITEMAAEEIHLGEPGLAANTGAVNGEAVDPYTGMTQFALGNASGVARVKK